MIEYRIEKGKSNFRPLEPIWPKYNPSGFKFRAVLDESCWWSAEEWQDDKDRNDWNKLCGLTGAFSLNNRRSAMVAWRPANEENTFLITGYTNNRRGALQWGWNNRMGRNLDVIAVRANQEFTGEVYLSYTPAMDFVSYRLQRPGTPGEPFVIEHKFNSSWHRLYRQMGTWFGGADNSPGPYGGQVHKPMRLWLDFKWIK